MQSQTASRVMRVGACAPHAGWQRSWSGRACASHVELPTKGALGLQAAVRAPVNAFIWLYVSKPSFLYSFWARKWPIHWQSTLWLWAGLLHPESVLRPSDGSLHGTGRVPVLRPENGRKCPLTVKPR